MMYDDDEPDFPLTDDADQPPPWWSEQVQAVLEDQQLAGSLEAPSTHDEPDLSPRERSAQRLTAIAALKKLLARLEAQEKADGGAWTRAGQRETVDLPTGERLGTVRTDQVKGGWRVSDPGLWLAWVAKAHPAKVVTVVTEDVDPGFTKATLAALDDTGEWPDPITGEILDTPPGLQYSPPSHKIVVTADPGAPAAVARFLGPVGRALGLPELDG